MRIILATALMAAVAAAAPATQSPTDTGPSGVLEQAFAANGRVSMDLSAGLYHVTGGGGDRIRLEWSVEDGIDRNDVDARIDVRGDVAAISTDAPDNSSFRVAIRLPTRADLFVRLTAGELTIEGVEGDKDVSLHAGELNIDIGRAEDYGHVEASVWAGEIDARPFGESRDGLFRSVEWEGTGPYRLDASLKAGEVRLYTAARN